MKASNDILPKRSVKALFEAIAKNDEQAFKMLFDGYRSRTYAVAFKLTKQAYASEEITQDVFISIWVSRAQLAHVKNAEAYIYTVIYNKVSRYLKKESNLERILQLSIWNTKPYSNETEETVFVHDQQKLLGEAVQQLSPQKKLMYELHEVQGKSYDEIAKILDLSPHTVKSHVLQAVKYIRNCLKDRVLFILMGIAYLIP
ncbi:MAG TPA: sigma-70 family RNA polymerase sigma factor [Niastella sp.]